MRMQSNDGKRARRTGSFLALLSFTAYLPVSCAAQAANVDMTLPVIKEVNGKQMVINGNVIRNNEKKKLNAQVIGGAGTVAQFDWKTFNVGEGAQVNWEFSANSQTALNRVLAGGGMSYIYGKLTESSATGCPGCVGTSKVILINPNGMLFGAGSSVNLNSFTASTKDIAGVKNVTEDLINDTSSTSYAKGTGEGSLFSIAGYNRDVKFVQDAKGGYGKIILEGAKFNVDSKVADNVDKVDANGNKLNLSTKNTAKSVVLIGDDIDIKNSKISTTFSSKPNATKGGETTQVRSNVKLITGDGVNFTYTSAGNVENTGFKVTGGKKQEDGQGIKISQDSIITTGNFYANNAIKGGDINIANSVIKTKKLIGKAGADFTAEQSGTSGNLVIENSGKTTIKNSTLRTLNDSVTEGDTTITSNGVQYGNFMIIGDGDIEITDSNISTADATGNKGDAGQIIIQSRNGNINLKDTTGKHNIDSAGDMQIAAQNDVTIDGYHRVKARGAEDNANPLRKLNISAANANITNSKVEANDLTVDADDKININGSKVHASDKLSLLGKNTTIENSTSRYRDLRFYDKDNKDKVNNVVIKKDARFADANDNYLYIETNGKLTVDNNSNIYADEMFGESKNGKYGIVLRSTGDDVLVYNSNIRANERNIRVTADKGDVMIERSILSASAKGGDGKTEKGNVKITAGEDAIITANSSISAAESGDKNTDSKVGNVEIKGKNVNISSKKYLHNDTEYSPTLNSINGDIKVTASNNINVGKSISNANNGSVILTADNDINTHNAYIIADNSAQATSKNGNININSGNFAGKNGVNISAKKDVNITSDITSIGTVDKDAIKYTGANIYSDNGNVIITSKEGDIITYNDVNISAAKTAKINAEKGSAKLAVQTNVEGKDVKVNAGDSILVGFATLKSNEGDVTLTAGKDIDVRRSDVNANGGYIYAKAGNDFIIENSTFKTANADKNIRLKAGNNFSATRSNINAGNNVYINAENGSIELAGTELLANNDAELTAKRGIYLASISNEDPSFNGGAIFKTKVVSKNGNVKVTSKEGDIQTLASHIAADNGTANIAANNGSILYNGDVNAKNINMTAGNNVTLISSSVYAKGGDVNVTAKNGKISVQDALKMLVSGETQYGKESRIVAEGVADKDGKIVGGNTTLSQGADMNLNEDFENALIGGTTKLTLKSNGSIIGKNLVNSNEAIGAFKDEDGTYKKPSTLVNKEKNARFTLSRNANLEAGENIELSSAKNTNLNFLNLTTKSGDKGQTKLSAGQPGHEGNLNLYGKTTINGGQKTIFEGANIKTHKGTIYANGNKLALNGTKDIDVKVSGVNNAEKGIDINADVNTGNANGNKYSQDALKGRNVKVDAGGEILAISKIKADKLTLNAGGYTGKASINYTDADKTQTTDNIGMIDKDGNDVRTADASRFENENLPYVEIRSAGEFNLDPSVEFNKDNTTVVYDQNLDTIITDKNFVGDPREINRISLGGPYTKIITEPTGTKITVTQEVVGKTQIPESARLVGQKEISSKTETVPIRDKNGNITGYKKITTTEYENTYEVDSDVAYKTTESRLAKVVLHSTTEYDVTVEQDYTAVAQSNQHFAKINGKDAYVVYSKKENVSGTEETTKRVADHKTTVLEDNKVIDTWEIAPTIKREKDKVTKTETKTITKDVPCETPDDIEIDLGDDISTWTRNPRKSEGISNLAPIQNDLADTTSAVVAAAARIQLDEDDDEEIEE